MYHQVDKLDKVQEYCFGGYGPAVKTDYLVACAAILGCLFWGLEQDATNNKVTVTAGMFERDCSQITRGTRTRKGSKRVSDRKTDGSSGCRWAHRAWTHRT